MHAQATDTIYELDQWACGRGDDPFKAPELQPTILHGQVAGHPNFEDGAQVKTAGIAHAEGRVVTISNGERFRLGEPHPDYRAWLAKNRPDWDPENPISKVD